MDNNSINLIIELYDITKLDTFLANFSLSKLLEETIHNIKDFNNHIIILVNTKHVLYKSCYWQPTETNKFASQIENYDKNRYIGTEITQMIESLYNNNEQSEIKFNKAKLYNNFQVYSFAKTYSRESMDNFHNFRTSLLKKALPDKCEFLSTLSQVFNDFYSSINVHELKKREFLRLVVFLGALENQIESLKLKNLLKTFSKQFSITFNIILLENDFSLTGDVLNDFVNFTDFRKDDDNFIVDERVNFINYKLNDKELKLKEISKLIYKAGKDLLLEKPLIEFIKKIDLLIRNYNFLYLDIVKNILNIDKINLIRELKIADNFLLNTKQVLDNNLAVINQVKDKQGQLEVYKQLIKNEEKDIYDKGK